MAIYRVVVKTTGSLQPNGNTFWNKEVLYCGTSLESARVAYLGSLPNSCGGSYGNRATETEIVEFESEPEDIESTEHQELDVENS